MLQCHQQDWQHGLRFCMSEGRCDTDLGEASSGQTPPSAPGLAEFVLA